MGIELMARDVERAQARLGSATFAVGDMRTEPFGRADAVVILDVLHYVDFAAQDECCGACASLGAGAELILRIGDAAGGWPSTVSAGSTGVTFARGHRNWRYYCRPRPTGKGADGARLRCGNTADEKGTPFANVMLVARLGSKCRDATHGPKCAKMSLIESSRLSPLYFTFHAHSPQLASAAGLSQTLRAFAAQRRARSPAF